MSAVLERGEQVEATLERAAVAHPERAQTPRRSACAGPPSPRQ